jgi:uncharacterized protein (TIGR03067 family)
MRKLTLVATITLISAVCASTWAGDVDKEKAKLQGTWTLTSVVIRGLDKTKKDDITWTFAGDKTTFKSSGFSEEGTFKIIDAAKEPKLLDITKGKDPKDEAKAIYALEGNVLKIAIGGPTGTDKPAPRPASFDDKDILVLTFKKNK